LTVRIYFQKEEYDRYKKQKGLPEVATGNFEPGGVVNVVYQFSVDGTLSGIRHEVSHFFTYKFAGSLPGYFGETFADALGEYQVPEFGVRWMGGPLEDKLRDKIRRGEPPDLWSALGSSGDHRSYCSEDWQIGFLVITYLLSDEAKTGVLSRAIRHMMDHHRSLDAFVDGLDMHYPGGMRGLQKDWEKWAVGYIDKIRPPK
jgi:hypothetical protein